MGRPRRGVTPEDRLWQYVDKTGACWLWRGSSPNGRYGALQVNGARVGAHVFSYMLHHKLPERPKGLVLHRCDMPRCVRPSHLYLGTQKQNARDALLRGKFGRAKITIKQAKWARGKPTSVVAAALPVSKAHAQALAHGRYWNGAAK